MNKQLPQTQQTTVIELRQKGVKSISHSNADYRTQLDKDLTIEPMDVVKIKSCFIDSVALNSDKITVQADVPEGSPEYATATFAEKNFKKISTTHNFYYRNWGKTYQDPETQRDYKMSESANCPFIDGRDYIATYESEVPGGEHQDLVTRIAFKCQDTTRHKKADPVHINLQYTQFAGTGSKQEIIRYLHVLVSQKAIEAQRFAAPGFPEDFFLDETVHLSGGSQTINFPIQCKRDSLVISQKNDKHQDDNGTQLHKGALSRGANEIAKDSRTASVGAVTFQPMSFPQDFLLRAGEYGKVELARELSQLLSRPSGNVMDDNHYDVVALGGGSVYPTELGGNTFLMTQESLRTTRGDGLVVGTRAVDGVAGANDTGGRVIFCAADGQNAFSFKVKNNSVTPQQLDYWLGSDEGIAIQYNQAVNKFELIQMHMSIRDANSNAVTRGTAIPGGKFVVSNKITGIYLQDLQPAAFWFGDMNFDKSLLIHETSVLQTAGTSVIPWDNTGAVVQRRVPLVPDLQDGINITGDSFSLANLTFKADQSAEGSGKKTLLAGGFAFDVAVNPLSFDVAVNQTTSIYADTNNGVGDTDDHEKKGFFKIEVDMGINNEIVGGEHNNKIKSVINRFYTVDSYTSSYGEGDILYQHPAGAAPIKTSDIGIRILKPDGTLSDEIGDANSVFLEIIKNR